jgi:hypothetical protein
MSRDPSKPPPLRKRPVWVWIISLFYVLGAVATSLSFIEIFSGMVPLDQAHKIYFQSMTPFDWSLTAIIGLGNLVGAILLFILRRWAYFFFAGAFLISLLQEIYQVGARNLIGVLGIAAFVGSIIGYGINIAIIIYSRSLAKSGLLK